MRMQRTSEWVGTARGLGAAVVAFLAAGSAWAQPAESAQGGQAPERRGVQVLPFVGVHSDLYAARVGYGWSEAGLLAGVIAGARMGERASLNGQLAYHSTGYSDLDRLTGGESASWDLTFSPLVHQRVGRVELVAGPRLGLYREHVRARDPTAPQTLEESRTGFIIGGQAGALVWAGPAAYGLVLSADLRHRRGSNPDFRISDLGSRGVFSASLAVLF
jgi:hypothetical protein